MSLFNGKIRPLELFSILNDLMKADQSISHREPAVFTALITKFNPILSSKIFLVPVFYNFGTSAEHSDVK